MSNHAAQTTVARPVSKQGVGLHTGANCALAILPAESDAGIVFVCGSGVEVPATVEYVQATDRSTTLGQGEARVGSAEHLLAALYGMGIDNARIELEGPEVPACDGSAQEWVSLLRKAGRRHLGKRREVQPLSGAVWTGEGASWSLAAPGSGLTLALGVDFSGTVAGRQTLWLPVDERRFAAELAPARTFALAQELEALRAAGLARGGSAENAFSVGPEGYSSALRFPDEVVRHKALDLMGDLALCGRRLEAHVFAVRPSHRTNVALARALREALSVGVSKPVGGEERRG